MPQIAGTTNSEVDAADLLTYWEKARAHEEAQRLSPADAMLVDRMAATEQHGPEAYYRRSSLTVRLQLDMPHLHGGESARRQRRASSVEIPRGSLVFGMAPGERAPSSPQGESAGMQRTSKVGWEVSQPRRTSAPRRVSGSNMYPILAGTGGDGQNSRFKPLAPSPLAPEEAPISPKATSSPASEEPGSISTTLRRLLPGARPSRNASLSPAASNQVC
jgi:hypothetical protein